MGRGAVGAAMALSDALESARKRDRLVLLLFDAPSRPLGAEMEEKTLRAPEVAKQLAEHFVFVRMDPEREVVLFRELVGGHGALATVVLDHDRDVLAAQSGYVDAPTLEDLLRRARRAAAAMRALRSQRDAGSRLRLADLYYDLSSLTRARTLWEAVAASGGAPAAVAHERLARLCVERGENQEARRHLQEVRRLGHAGDQRAALTDALVLMLERRVSDARQRLMALSGAPHFAETDHALFALGLCEHELKEDARAITTLERLIHEYPRSRFVGAARNQIEHIRNPEPDHEH